MKFLFRFGAVLFIASMVLMASCGSDSTKTTNNTNTTIPTLSAAGMLQIRMTDAPIDAKEVWVRIGEIDVHATGGGWETFSADAVNLELLSLNGSEALVAFGPLEEGGYTGIRLRVQEGHLVDQDEQTCELKVPSNKIKVPVAFEIHENNVTSVLLDFVAEDSVHVVKAGKSMKCILRPVLIPVSVDETS